MFRFLICIVWSLWCVVPLAAQTIFVADDQDQLVGLDESLFHLYEPENDPYSEATKYYRPQLSQRRRGLDWWISDDVVSPIKSVDEVLKLQDDKRSVRLYGSTDSYNMGLSMEYIEQAKSSKGWSKSMDIDFRTGRDVNIEGVFRQDLRSTFALSREFSRGHYLTMNLDIPILMRGLQSDVSQEAITLTGDNLYNPSWGFYNGEVRNSRVSKYAIPKFTAHYQRALGGDKRTTLVANLEADYGRRSISRLGWYDAYNPTPDYYRKLPSYVEAGDIYNQIEQAWRDDDTNYTQVAWDKLVAQNQLSSDGSAHYVVENQVERVTNIDMQLIFSSEVGDDGVNLIYGVRGAIDRSRYFKEMDDLLGGEYLMDYDLYIGDYINLNTELQNDLRNPDRKILEGDRFGYDYTLKSVDIGGVLGLEYRNADFNLALRGEFGERRIGRIGHYEKERFAGSLSYGESAEVSLPSNRFDAKVGYSPSGRHHFAIKGLYHQLPLDESDLFVQVQSANRVIDNPTSRSLGSVSLGYRFQSPNFSLDIEGYLLYSSNQTEVYSYYDDLTYTYSDVVVSGIGSRSVGVDIVSDWRISKKLTWEVAIALGDYTYDMTPVVTLYSDNDLSLLSTSEASAIEGCKIGNAPQILVTSSLTYFVDYGLILSFDCSYGGGRYVAPSFVRRTDRVIYAAESPEMESEIVTQESLDSVFDITMSVVKTYWLRSDRKLSFNFRVNNLLGDCDRVDYGRESNRILTTSGGSSIGSRYVEQNSYVYSSPRTFYLSCSYLF